MPRPSQVFGLIAVQLSRQVFLSPSASHPPSNHRIESSELHSDALAAPDPTAMTRTQIGMSLLFMTRCIISE